MIYVALPAINELNFIYKTIECIRQQRLKDKIKVFICVNQPESWHNDKNKLYICQNNEATIKYLKEINDLNIKIIDRSSKGIGWRKGSEGVGFARNTIMNAINQEANDEDIIISLDADTLFGENYFQSISDNLKSNVEAVAVSLPYYHSLTEDEAANRAILRYEIYMRYYILNLFRIGCPYSFTALGSAIALPVKSYRAIGGMTPKKSGEDFYFLQKLCKYGKILIWNDEQVYPAARFSDRVFFGTGPAMIKGNDGDWTSYPIYDYKSFDDIEKTYKLFTDLFYQDLDTPVSSFVIQNSKDSDYWQQIRTNSTNIKGFIKACHIRFDGLRILQYLKFKDKDSLTTDEENLKLYFNKFFPQELKQTILNLNFLSTPSNELAQIRDFFKQKEDCERMKLKFTGIICVS